MFSAPQPASRGAETTIPQSTSRRMVASLEFSDVSILRRALHPRESRGGRISCSVTLVTDTWRQAG